MEYGIVYLLTNPVMPGLVKIGMTTQNDIDKRMKELYTTGVPVPFECQFACRVNKSDCARIEKALHKAFEPQRINANREFFRINVEQARAILELFHHEDVTYAVTDEIENNLTDEDKAASNKVNAESETGMIQLQFWTRFREKMLATGKFKSLETPKAKYWFNVAIGRSHIYISNACNTWSDIVGVRLYIESRVVDKYLPALTSRKAEINKALGIEPVWDANPAAKDKTIAIERHTNLKDLKEMELAVEWMVQTTLAFLHVFSAEVKKI